jgi:tetratricopeptide (TPR) repeat protein
VALVTFVAFLPALRAGFVTWDDNGNFLDNYDYRGLGPAQLQWMWTTFHMGHYVPLAWMTLGFDYVIGGMNPFGYHLHNVLLHAVNAVLVFALAVRILETAQMERRETDHSRTVVAAAVAALLFAVHPLRVESVAWVTERRDVLSMLFCLTSVLCYLRSVAGTGGARRWYVLSVGAFVAALLSKATSMSLPAVLLVLNVFPLRRIGGTSGFWTPNARRVYAELLPFAALALGTAALSLIALKPPTQLSFSAKLAVSAYSVVFYLMKTVWPTGLAPLYEMPRRVDPLAVRYVVSAIVLVVLSALMWIGRRRFPGIAAAWVVFLFVLAPLSGVVQNGPQIAADRYTYHAAPALAILVGAGVQRWLRSSSDVRALAVAFPIAMLAVLTWRQTEVWHDSGRLWSRVLSVDPTSSIAHVAIGDLLIREGRLAEAETHYRRGVELDPTFATGFNNLGVLLARQGRFAEAVDRYRQALELRPAYADAHNNWGIALSEQGDYGGAIAQFRETLAIDPRLADAEVNIGNALVRQQRAADALAHYERAAALKPDNADAYLNWGVALAQLGKLEEAVVQFTKVLAIQPDNADARTYLDRADQMRSAATSRSPTSSRR